MKKRWNIKIKLWQKIYLLVLVISIVFVNGGIYLVFQLTYQKNIEAEQVRGEVDDTVIRNSIQKNMKTMEREERLTEDAVTDLIQIYEEDYTKQKMKIQLWKNQSRLYPKGQKQIPYPVDEGQTKIVVRGARQQKELAAVSEWKMGQDTYYLCIQYPLEELNATWGQLYRIYLVLSFGISFVLALSLSILLHFLLRPLNRLVLGVSDIQRGDYSSRVKVRGGDELACLGENINAMAEAIETNIKALEEENKRKQQLVDNLAHEMKSPLTSIYGFAEYVMKSKADSEETVECCSFIMEESERMKEMCYTLMDLSEIRHKKMEYSYFSAEEFAAGIRAVAARQLAKSPDKGEVEIEIVSRMQKDIFGNRRLLEMLVMNLLDNAVRACRGLSGQGRDRPKVIVWLEPGNDTEKEFRIKVRDEGTGIPEDKIRCITEPFYRMDKGRSREYGGNGLGLALCRQIVEKHQGTLEFESVVGKGTEVTAFLWQQ